MAAFLANVGVNASHAARSPLFADASFRLLPIPESRPHSQPMLRFADLGPELTGETARVPVAWLGRAAHLDPDLASCNPTYGDNCRRAARAFSLRRAEPGDSIIFLARLVDGFGRAALHLVGQLVIAGVLRDVQADPGQGWWDGNAHVRRARAGGSWDSFWVFRGGAGTRLFRRALRFGRAEADEVFGQTWDWRAGRSEQQTIASYTRTIRRLIGRGEEALIRMAALA